MNPDCLKGFGRVGTNSLPTMSDLDRRLAAFDASRRRLIADCEAAQREIERCIDLIRQRKPHHERNGR